MTQFSHLYVLFSKSGMAIGSEIPICMHKPLQMTVIPLTEVFQLKLSLVVRIGPKNSLC